MAHSPLRYQLTAIGVFLVEFFMTLSSFALLCSILYGLFVLLKPLAH